MALLYDGKTYGRELGRISPEGNIYGQRALVRELTRFFWWDGHDYVEIPETVDQAAGFELLPMGPRPFGELWRALRYIPAEGKNVWDYYFWDSEAEGWKQIRWLWAVDSLGELPRPGLFVGAAHRFSEKEIEIVWDGYQWKRLNSHRGLADDEPERHLPPGLIELFVADVKLSYRSPKELALDPVPGGKGHVFVNGERIDAGLECSVFSTLPVLMWDDMDRRIFSTTVAANTEYFVYLANKQSEEYRTDVWDFRGKLFLSGTQPVNGYLSASGSGRHARVAGKIQTNAYGRFIRELDISLISRGPSLTETFREYSDFSVVFVDQNTIRLQKNDNAYGQIYVPEELRYIGEGNEVSNRDKWLSLGDWESVADGTTNTSEVDAVEQLIEGSRVLCSSQTYGYEGWRVFDNESGLNRRWLTAVGNNTGWVAYDFGDEDRRVINKYRWRTMETDSNAVPGQWTLEGSNDGVEWTRLHGASNNVKAPNTWIGWFGFSNSVAYRYYRFFVIANLGHLSYVTVDEIELVQAQEVFVYTPEKMRIKAGPLLPSSTWYLYIANDVDSFNFNAINPDTNRPWQVDDLGAASRYSAELDLRLKMFASNCAPDHGRLMESEPGFWTRYLGKVETDAYGRFRHRRDISAVNPVTLDPMDFEGLAEIQIVPVDNTSFKIAAIRGTSGSIFVGGDTVTTRDADDPAVHTVRTTDTVYAYRDGAVESPLAPQMHVSAYARTKFYVYMANSRSVWGQMASKTFVCNVAPASGMLSENWPGNQARWLVTLTTSAEGLFTGDYAHESVAPLFARINDGATSLNTTWSSKKTSSALDAKINDTEVTIDKTWSSYKIGTAIATAVGASLGPSTVAAGLPFRLEYHSANYVRIVFVDTEDRPIYFPDEQMIRFYKGEVFHGALPSGTGIRYVGLTPDKRVIFDANPPGKSNLGIFSIGSAYYVGVVGMPASGTMYGTYNVDSHYYGVDLDFQTSPAQDSTVLTLPGFVAARDKKALMTVSGGYTGTLYGDITYRSKYTIKVDGFDTLTHKYCTPPTSIQSFSYTGISPRRIMTQNYYIDFSVTYSYPASISEGISNPSFSVSVSRSCGWLVDIPCDCDWCQTYQHIVYSKSGVNVYSEASTIRGHISIRNN